MNHFFCLLYLDLKLAFHWRAFFLLKPYHNSLFNAFNTSFSGHPEYSATSEANTLPRGGFPNFLRILHKCHLAVS